MKQTPLPHWLQELFSLDTFHPRPIVKLALHISIGVLLLPCIVCGIVRLGGGGSTNVVGQSLKSYTFLLYIALTERQPRFQRWASTRAYAWLTASEILFWIVTFGLSAKGAGSSCNGSGCIAGYLLVVLTMVLEFLYIYSTYIYVQTYMLWKRGGLAKDGIRMAAVPEGITKSMDVECSGG